MLNKKLSSLFIIFFVVGFIFSQFASISISNSPCDRDNTSYCDANEEVAESDCHVECCHSLSMAIVQRPQGPKLYLQPFLDKNWSFNQLYQPPYLFPEVRPPIS